MNLAVRFLAIRTLATRFLAARLTADHPDTYRTESRRQTSLSRPRLAIRGGTISRRGEDCHPAPPYHRKEIRRVWCAARPRSPSTQTLKNPARSWRPESSLFRPSEAVAQAWESFCLHC